MNAPPPTDGMGLSAEEAALLEAHREREARGLERREAAAELALSLLFLLAAVPMALSVAPVPAAPTIALVAAYAVLSTVEFEVGDGCVSPVALVFWPMLFVLPPAAVPLCVALGLLVRQIPPWVAGRRPGGKLVLALGDSAYALGPALVFLLVQPGGPTWADAPVYAAALAAQFALDAAITAARLRAAGVPRVAAQMRMLRYVWLVDLLLFPTALLTAAAAYKGVVNITLTLPLVALFVFFASERRKRLDQALELGQAYQGTALLLGDLIEADDAYTGSHTRGVVELSLAVAEHMGLSASVQRDVRFGALLHDVGKIVVPSEIINKPGKLNEDEWAIMRTHTIEGQRMLEGIGGALARVGTIVRGTHERWDGAGYPDGVAGEQIPLEARIVCACDAFSAMTTHRPYRQAMSVEVALAELRACAGAQFDPVVVSALIATVEADPPATAVVPPSSARHVAAQTTALIER